MYSAQPEFFAECDAVRLLNEQRVWSAVDDEAVDVLTEDDAAHTFAGFEQREGDTAHVQLVSGGEPGDAAADHYHG